MKNTRNWIIALLIFYAIVGVTICIIYLHHDDENNLYSVNRIDPGQVIGTAGIDSSSVLEPAAESAAQESASAETTPEPDKQDEALESESLPAADSQLTPNKEYYSFKSTNRSQRLNIRKTPGMNGAIIGRISPGASGYILEKGEEWSKVVVNDIIGYAKMEYLELTPCDPSDYPPAYQ